MMDHLELRIHPLETRDLIQAALAGVDEHGAVVSKNPRLVGAVVGRQPDRLDQCEVREAIDLHLIAVVIVRD